MTQQTENQEVVAMEEALISVMWKIRHRFPEMVVEITQADKREMGASFAYTKQEPCIKVVDRPGKQLIVLVDKDGNAIRPCESDEAQQSIAERARAREQAFQDLTAGGGLLDQVAGQAARGEFSSDLIATLCQRVRALNLGEAR